MKRTTHSVSARVDGGDEGADADAELARRVVEWLRGDDEGRRILRALAERRTSGVPDLARRLQRPDLIPPMAGARDRARLLPLAGTGLFLGGFLAFMLGVLALGLGDRELPPLLVLGVALMLLAATPLAVGGILTHWHRRRRAAEAPATEGRSQRPPRRGSADPPPGEAAQR